MKRRMLLLVALMAILTMIGATLAAPALAKKAADNPPQDLVCKDSTGDWSEIFPCDLGFGTGNAHGKIHYNGKTMRANLHGLAPNTWYFVSMQTQEWVTSLGQFSGAEGLFGMKTYGATPWITEWVDVGLVKTNNGGNWSGVIPTDSGLTGSATPVCETGNVPALVPGPAFDSGTTYSGITTVVKRLLPGADGTTPDCGDLISGGFAELFETAPMTFTIP